MKLATLNTQKSNIGTCPHGLPAGACPICSGMGGGVKRADFSAKPGEMSWNECAAIGRMLRAQKAAKQAHDADYQNRVSAMVKFAAVMSAASERAVMFAQAVQNSMPSIFSKPIAFIAKNIVAGSIDLAKNIVVGVANFVQSVGQKFVDITDKLTAVYGEAKAAVSKKISDIVGDIKKKVKSLFAIFETFNADDEDKKIDEAKRTFELKKFIQKLSRKLRKYDKD